MVHRAGASVSGTLLFSLVAFAQSPNLIVTKTADATSVPTGATIGFTIKVSNSTAVGTGTAFNAVLKDDPLPNNLQGGIIWTISPPYLGPGTCTISALPSPPLVQSLHCNFGDLAPGGQAMIHVQSGTLAPPNSNAGTFVNTASVSADNEPTGPSASATITVLPPPPPNLGITKTADASPVPTGATIGFTIKVSNSSAAGTGTAFNAVLKDDPLPVGVAGGIIWTISPPYLGPGTCTISALPSPPLVQSLHCNFGDLAPGGQAMIHVQSGTLAPPNSNAGTFVNTASVSADNEPTGPSASASITVLPPPPPNLGITKTADASPVPTGATIGFTIKVSNSTAAGTG